ncbi:acetolactate synthase small subunit, partial [Escherichia coli]|nr:acetolactate synthase small subunit [Escherichia coli]
SDKIDAFVDTVRPYGIKQMARTGVTGFTRSPKKMG